MGRDLSLYAFLTAVAVPFVFPLVWMVSASLKPLHEVFASPPTLVGSSVEWGNYAEIFTAAPFAQQYWNSTYIAVATVMLTIVVSVMSGFAFARIRFPGRDVIFVVMLTGLFLPVETVIVPLFLVLDAVGLTGTHLPLILEPAFGAPSIVGAFVMRQAFLALPRELEEAARIDGRGWFGILWHIAIPLVWPSIATVALLTFLASWNMFLEPLVLTGGAAEMWTVPIGLDQYVDFMGTPYWSLQMAATTLAVAPFLVLFLLMQRQITRSIATSGLK
jgi:multiple sugar transport system permease protein